MPKSPKAKALAEIRAKALAQMKSAYYFQLISSYFDPKEDPFLGEIRNGNRIKLRCAVKSDSSLHD